jgi:lipoprotein-releasing system ATP-binding protein
LIALRSLTKEYVDGSRVVRVQTELDFDVAAGERVAIVGESGVGKSTLLHILGTLDRPTRGEVWFDGEDLAAKSDRELAHFRNREVGFIFQFHHLLPDFTALENVMMPARIGGLARDEAERRARALLERVGLLDRLDHKPGELSGGEQQRVAVARALVQRPRVVLADEPTGNLDPATGEGVQQLLTELNRERDVTLVVVTHNAGLAGAMDRTVRLAAGHVVPEPVRHAV